MRKRGEDRKGRCNGASEVSQRSLLPLGAFVTFLFAAVFFNIVLIVFVAFVVIPGLIKIIQQACK